MKLVEKYDLVKNKYPYHVILIKSGNFWVTYKKDSIICKYVFGYALKNNKVAFPNKVLNKNLSKLKHNYISYILVYELDNIIIIDNINNSYTFYFNKYKDMYIEEIKYNKLIDLINNKIKNNNIDYLYNNIKNI